ncbi:MAG: hypothetical protein IPJ65_26040 [Archangiaceae bacterium]|nr:hypothetical protein [Archangiaceae bacterium]
MSKVPKNDVLFFGMNKFTSTEARAVKTSSNDVKVIKDAPKDDTITVGRGRAAQTFDLTTDAGRQGFVKTLGLPKKQGDDIEKILKGASSDTRDELAQLAQAWAVGEKGGVVPGRMVLSGHSIGNVLWGGEHDARGRSTFENGMMQREDFLALANAMPKAASQVQDIAISACFCGGETNLNAWKSAFPNVKTVTAYDGFSPSGDSASGSPATLKKWERLTRGDVEDLKPEQFRGTEKWKNMATWSVKHGYLRPGGQEKPEVVQARIDAFKAERGDFMSGAKTSATALSAYYTDLQNLSGRSTTSAADKVKLDTEIAVMVRLRHYGGVAGTFQKDNQAALKSGFDSLGLKVPDFGKLSRKDAMAKISEFETAAAKQSPQTAETKEALRLLTGLKELDPKLTVAS